MDNVVRTFVSVYVSLGFLVINVVVLLIILALNRRAGPSSAPTAEPEPPVEGDGVLPASDILGREFDYARVTASEAMHDRHTMVNFYLLVTGVLLSGVAAVLSRETELPKMAGTLLLWLLTGVGWFYFLKIIRLRQAWHDSARAMNQIKDFYIQHSKEFDADVLRESFRWKTKTLPPPDRPWTVFFYSAILVGFLDSAAYVAGSALLILDPGQPLAWTPLALLSVSGLAFFAFHVWLYFAFLRTKSTSVATSAEQEGSEVKEAVLSSNPTPVDDAGPWVKILDEVEDYSFRNAFRVLRARLQFRRFDGRLSEPVTRISFERGDSVGVLLYDPEDDAVVLVRQFRYPVYAGLDPDERVGEGAKQAWLLEIVAGVQEAGQSVREVAHQELLEEAGYRVRGELQPITTVYPSPGGTSERIHLFLGEVDHRERAGEGGGVAEEGEDTRVVVRPFREAMDMVAHGEICDAKTVIALQHLALQEGGAW